MYMGTSPLCRHTCLQCTRTAVRLAFTTFRAIHFPFSSNQCYSLAPYLPPLHIQAHHNDRPVLSTSAWCYLFLHMEAISHAAAPLCSLSCKCQYPMLLPSGQSRAELEAARLSRL